MIGIYDSGAGGISVLREIKKILFKQDYLFYGDNAHMPFGDKSSDEIISFTKEALDFFSIKKVDGVVIACNTSSAVALPKLTGYDFPIIGVIDPAVKTAEKMNLKNPLVLSTTATANSGVYQKKLSSKNAMVLGNTDLAPAIERDLNVDEIIIRELNRVEKNYDGVVLACTHYPLIEDVFKKYIDVPIINPAEETARELYEILPENLRSSGNSKIYLYGTAPGIENILRKFLGDLNKSASLLQFP